MPVTAGKLLQPGEENLAPVLSNIGWGMLAATRAKLANSSETRDFLEIGQQLLQEDLLRHTGPDFDRGERSRLFESLSRERILNRAAELDTQNSKILTVNMFRHRWDRKDRYTEDLIAYLFRLGPPQEHMSEMEQAAEEILAQDVSLRELVRLLAASEVRAMLADQSFSILTIIQTALPNHPRVREFARAQYELLLPRWAALYERVANHFQLKLRPEFTWLDVALVFHSVVEGALIRARLEGQEPVMSGGEGVLAGSIIAMLPGLLEGLPADF